MAKERITFREISIVQSKGAFSIFKKTDSSRPVSSSSGVSDLRKLLSKEKAKILNAIRVHNPSSVYELSKQLGRNFKSVSDDIKFLKKWGLVELKPEQTKKRRRLRPVIAIHTLKIQIRL